MVDARSAWLVPRPGMPFVWQATNQPERSTRGCPDDLQPSQQGIRHGSHFICRPAAMLVLQLLQQSLETCVDLQSGEHCAKMGLAAYRLVSRAWHMGLEVRLAW